MKRVRNSNFELLRIAAMVLIVGSHVVGHGVFLIYGDSDASFLNFASGNIINRIIAGIFAPCGDIGNAIFFLLMGFFYNFGNSHRQRMQKLLRLTIKVYFYMIVALIVFVIPYFSGIYKYDELGTSGIIKVLGSMILPMESECWWFITTYVFIFVLFGGLSFIDKLPQETFRKILAIIFVIGLFRYNSGSYNKILEWGFIVLIGIYIRKFVNVNKVEKNRLLIVALGVLTWSLAIGMTVFFYKYHMSGASFMIRAISRVVNSIGVYMKYSVAICTLLLTMTLKIGHSKWINNISGATLAVYLFHGSPFFIYFFFKHFGIVTASYNTLIFPMIFCMVILGIFAVSLLLDAIHKRLSLEIEKILHIGIGDV